VNPAFRHCLPVAFGAVLLALGATGCDRKHAAATTATTSGPLTQRAYVWQREWTRQVSQSVSSHAGSFEELAVLAAQVEWHASEQSPALVRPVIDWMALKGSGTSVGLVVRVHRAGDGSQVAKTVADILHERLAEALAAGVPVSEFQIDYDCPQKALAGYLRWLTEVRDSMRDTHIPLRITSLPSWLGEPEFAALADVSDGYILQVHSFDLTAIGRTPTVCDAEAALGWVGKAARLGRPFYVALPTYRCLAGYAPDGHSLGMAADAGAPAWAKGTRVLELTSDAGAIATLVAGWIKERPASMRGLYWYRLPIEGEARNWRWTTLAVVMSGRVPERKWEVHAGTGNPADFTLWNTGEDDEVLPRSIRITWPGPERIAAADAVGGWTSEVKPDSIEFNCSRDGSQTRLPPGSSTPLGWIRYHETPAADVPFAYDVVR
jgi:hypothetical protein